MKKACYPIVNRKFLLALSIISSLSACGGSGGESKGETKPSESQAVSSTIASENNSSSAKTASSQSFTVSSSTSNKSAISSSSISSSSPSSSEPAQKPNAFTFTAVTEAKANTIITSNPITVTGITKAVSISVSGGEYAIDGGAYTSSPGSINNNQKVTLKVKSVSASNATNQATLNISGMTGSFKVTTLEDAILPTAQIMFPTPGSLTEGTSVLVRGIASDNVNEIASLTVNGILATTTDGYSNWQAEVPLTSGVNTLAVSVTDAASNTATSVATAKIKSGLLETNRTSDSQYVLDDPVGVTLDTERGRAIVIDRVNLFTFFAVAIDLKTTSQERLTGLGYYSNHFGGLVLDITHNRALFQNVRHTTAVDLTSSKMTTFFEDSRDSYAFGLRAITLDTKNDRMLLVDADSQQIRSINLTSGAQSILSDNTIPNSVNAFISPYGVALDAANNRALVTDYKDNTFSILAVDLTTGERSALSTNTIPDTNNTLTRPEYITMDTNHNRALVADKETIVAVDLATGARSLVTSPSAPDTINKLTYINGMTVDSAHNIAYVAPYGAKAIFAVDLITGKRVVFAK